MQNTRNKDSDQSSICSSSNFVVTCPSWWNASGSHILPSSPPKDLNMNMGSQMQYCNPVKQIGSQLQDQDSSSKSNGQSDQDGEDMRRASPNDQWFSAHSGKENIEGKRAEDSIVSASSLGTSDVLFPPAEKVDFNQSVTYFPYTYVDPYYGGVMAGYGSHAMIHPQVVRVAPPTRVPLPLEFTENGPIYVNAKQYHGIIRRRERRAKLESQNKLVKVRKPYLHESRHLHAMKRARGSGGRFLNMKKEEEQQQQQSSTNAILTADGRNSSSSSLFQTGGAGCLSESEVLQSDNMNMGSSGSTCSEITSISDVDMYQLPNALRFLSDYQSHRGGSHASWRQHGA